MRQSSILRVRLSGMLHRRDMRQNCGVVAPVRLIVEDDEIADVLVERRASIRLYSSRSSGIEALVREEREQPGDAGLDQVDAGRFERLEEARRQAERDARSVPGFLRRPVVNREAPRLGERLRPQDWRAELAAASSSSMMCAGIHDGRCPFGAAAGCATASRLRARSSG